MTMSKNWRSISAGLLVVGVIVTSYIADAHARSIGGMAGRAVNPGDAACFQAVSGGVVNNCAGTRRYEVSVPVDSSGNKTVQVFYKSPSAMNCYAFGETNIASAGYGPSSSVVVNFSGGWRKILLYDVYVPSQGSLNVGCDLAQGERMQTIDY